jgi:hypothetical protein
VLIDAEQLALDNVVSGAGGLTKNGAGSYGGSFSATNLPVGTTWNTTQLVVNGTIQVVSVTPLQFTGVTFTNGSMQLALSGPAGNGYRVWANTNVVAAPITNTWTLLVTNGLFNVNGNATFTDVTAANFPMRFDRVSVS